MLQSDGTPDIGLMWLDTLSDDFGEAIADTLTAPELTIEVIRIPQTPSAGLELYLPAAAMLFIAKSYFDGFLQKAGEDHYELLKAAGKQLWRKASALKLFRIGTTGKLAATPKYSMAYSIIGDVGSNIRFKFILQADFDDANADAGISAFLDLIRDIHSDSLSEDDLTALLQYRPVGGTVLVAFDPAKQRIVPVDAFADN